MQTQIPQHQDIPDKYFKVFKSLNTQGNWWHRPLFYELKSKILEKYGTTNDFDLQVIERDCYACDGTGWYSYQNECYHCNKGVYRTDFVALKRYILNGEVFHCPTERLSSYSEEFARLHNPQYRFVGTINGIIKHDTEPINKEYSLFVLLHKYDKKGFFYLINWYVKSYKTRTKYKFTTALRKHKRQLDGLKEFFVPSKNIEIQSNELPF